MERVKKDWQRSEGRVRSVGKSDLRTDKKLRAYHPAERERSRENRSNEMMRMENSYGGIAIGASRRKKMTMVFHEERRHNGPGIKKDEREVEGSRTVPLSRLEGDFRTNSHDRRDSAMLYRERLEESPVRMMRKLQEMLDENRQESGERTLPFLDLRKDRQEREDTERELRESLEKRRMSEYDRLREKRESLRQESAQTVLSESVLCPGEIAEADARGGRGALERLRGACAGSYGRRRRIRGSSGSFGRYRGSARRRNRQAQKKLKKFYFVDLVINLYRDAS